MTGSATTPFNGEADLQFDGTLLSLGGASGNSNFSQLLQGDNYHQLEVPANGAIFGIYGSATAPAIPYGKDIIYATAPIMTDIGLMAAPIPMVWDMVNNAIGFDSSTIKKKKNVIDLNFNASDFFSKVRAVEFDWKGSGRNDIGFIAEEIEQYDERLVTYITNDDGEKEVSGVYYDRMTVHLVEAVKYLKAEIESLKSEIEQLKK